MPRASAELASAGLQAIPAPTHVVERELSVHHPLKLLPSVALIAARSNPR